MHSALYFYLRLQPETAPGVPRARAEVEGIIRAVEARWRAAGSAEAEAWIDLRPVLQDEQGNYADDGGVLVNCIPVVASRGAELAFYLPLLEALARELGWTVFEEENDDGEEDVALYRPSSAQRQSNR